jgi:hypothetical protein
MPPRKSREEKPAGKRQRAERKRAAKPEPALPTAVKARYARGRR